MEYLNRGKMRKLIKLENKEAKGISVDSLRKSRNIRADFLNRYGIIPSSILSYDRSDKALDRIVDGGKSAGNYESIKARKIKESAEKKKLVPGLEKSGFVLQGEGVRGKGIVYLSRFPQNIGRIMVQFYCPKDGIVYDPFAGHNSRMELCLSCGRDYIGVDVSAEYMKANRRIKKTLLNRQTNSLGITKQSRIRLIEGSSDTVNLLDSSADFTVTSPPYWNLEYYGDESTQLGNAKTYDLFLELLFNHIKENYRILKSGSFCAWFINDFRKDGKFYPFHIDLYTSFLVAGFIPFNIYVVDLGPPIAATFVQSIEKTKIFPKQHEYCLLFKVEK